MNSSQGEVDLTKLLASMQPTLNPEVFVFLSISESILSFPTTLRPQMLFQEAEGLTIVTTEALAASHGYQGTFSCRMITLKVHSSLEAVGLIATLATALKERNISSNVVSGYFHDHIFVPSGKEEDALKVLEEVARKALAKQKVQL
ncbi:ACT domain-containing protein [Lipomyces doorenjongii]